MIPYGRQDISKQDVDAVQEVLTSDFLTQGPAVPRFEAALAAYVEAAHGIAFSNATAALHIACLALGLGKGDIAWTSPVTFVASSNAILYCGASVDFVDIDPTTYNMCADALEAKLIRAEKNGRLPTVVIPVALCGQSCDMARISELGQKYGFHIIEDASHAVGGRYRNNFVGRCDYADITVFSFHPVKIITTAEGGMAMTQNTGLAEKMRLLRSHGVTRNPTLMQGESHGPWYYQQIDLGFNYRMTDLQAALGYSQMQRLNTFVAKRTKLASRYDALLEDLPVHTPYQHPETASAWHLYVIQLAAGTSPKQHRRVFESLQRQGIGVNLHYIPVHTQPYYQKLGFKWGDFPNAEAYYRKAISLPLYPKLGEAAQQQVVAALQVALT